MEQEDTDIHFLTPEIDECYLQTYEQAMATIHLIRLMDPGNTPEDSTCDEIQPPDWPQYPVNQEAMVTI
jgi:hypothetical protein